jgi:hypothetical protein
MTPASDRQRRAGTSWSIQPNVWDSDGSVDHGSYMSFRRDALERSELVRLENTRIGLECPDAITATGGVNIDGETVAGISMRLRLDADAYIYKVVNVSAMLPSEVTESLPGVPFKDTFFRGDPDRGSLSPELLRRIRWGQIIAAAVSRLCHVVILEEDGSVSEHRSLLTLTDEEQVAALWLQARLARLDPNKHIADSLGLVSPAAAAGRVRRARGKKLIPSTTQGQRH